MRLINSVVGSIMKKIKDGDTIRGLAEKTSFAYSAVYRWVHVLSEYGVLDLKDQGNKTKIFVRDNFVYKKFVELVEAMETMKRDKVFWSLVRRTKQKVRFVGSTAVVIWTEGGYITGDFYDKIYHMEVLDRDFDEFTNLLESEGIKKEGERPFVILNRRKDFSVEEKDGLPVMPLKELVSWCEKIHLGPVLEQLDLMYGLGLKRRYSERFLNV